MRTAYLWVLTATLGCATPDEEGLECPAEDERYVPTGANVDDAEDCPAERCPLFCSYLICELPPGRYTDFFCEPCEDIEAFADGACAGCGTTETEGGIQFICGEL